MSAFAERGGGGNDPEEEEEEEVFDEEGDQGYADDGDDEDEGEGDDEDDYFVLESDASSYYDESPRSPPPPPFKFATASQHVEVSKGMIEPLAEQIKDVYGISQDTAEALLACKQWELKEIFQSSDPSIDSILESVGLGNIEGNPEYGLVANHIRERGALCQLYCGEVGTFSLPCHHILCNDCCKQYFGGQIEEGQHILKCFMSAANGCKCIATSAAIRRLPIEPKALELFDKNIANAFLMKFKDRFKYCPRPDCVYFVYDILDRESTPTIICKCAYEFCAFHDCSSSQDHLPCSCVEVEDWMDRIGDSKTSEAWIRLHTRPCPNCQLPLEKNEGCNHMTCRAANGRGGCGHEFCWVCMGSWKIHNEKTGGYFNCKIPVAETRNSADLAVEARKLERFTKYSDLYIDFHNKERKSLSKLNEYTCETPTLYLKQKSDSHQIQQVNHIINALKVIAKGCRALKYSYICSFNMSDKDIAKPLFEHQQDCLKQSLDNLEFSVNVHLDHPGQEGKRVNVKLGRGLSDVSKLVPTPSEIIQEASHCATFLKNISVSFEEKSNASKARFQTLSAKAKLESFNHVPKVNWDCPTCTYHNEAVGGLSRLSCEMCGTRNPAPRTPNISSSNTTSSASASGGSGGATSAGGRK